MSPFKSKCSMRKKKNYFYIHADKLLSMVLQILRPKKVIFYLGAAFRIRKRHILIYLKSKKVKMIIVGGKCLHSLTIPIFIFIRSCITKNCYSSRCLRLYNYILLLYTYIPNDSNRIYM